MERSVQIKVIKESKVLYTYSSSFSIPNTTTVKSLKELCKKRFSLSYPIEEIREVVLSNSLEISEKRVVPQKTSLEYFIYLEDPTGFRKLNRQHSLDERDLAYPVAKLMAKAPPVKKPMIKLWESDGWWGDQGDSPECVGYAWAHWLDDRSFNKKVVHPILPPSLIYNEAKKLDEWPGENYEGTSVRGGVKALKVKGKVSFYHWGFTLDSLINTVLYLGPVVVGTSWYQNMFYPNKLGIIRATGVNAGGHAYVVNGVDLTKKLFRIKNSWGRDWGQQGHAWISFSDMSRLIREQGELCYAN